MTLAAMFNKIDFSLKRRVKWIAVLHGVVTMSGLLHAILHLVLEQRPITDSDILYMLVHTSFQAFLISTLVIGTVMEMAIFFLPWLLVTFPVFSMISYYIIKYSRFTYISQTICNILFICTMWYCWLTVYRFCRSCNKQIERLEKT